MIELALAAADYAAIRSELVGGDTEKCAIIFVIQFERPDGLLRLLGREIQFPTPSDYTRIGRLEAELKPEFVARITKRARKERNGLVFVHSHPGKESPTFSWIDDQGEEHLAGFLTHRHPLVHAAMVVSQGGLRARRLGTDEPIRVISIGASREVIFDLTESSAENLDIFDRQIRAFGADGQQSLQKLRVAIVGLGGTGSLVAQQLAHLGVRDFILIDPDVVELTNLNRVVNASHSDIGRAKVDVAAEYIEATATGVTITRIQGDIIQVSIARKLLNADIIIGCTDSHGSRSVLQQIAFQYLIPLIDMGVTIVATQDRISHIFGRVQLLAPGLSCFTCSGLLDPNEVRRDMMTAYERKADPYIQGAREPAPAVISLNGTVASLAITMMLSVIADVPVTARHILYNAIASTIRSVGPNSKSDCYICSRSGAFARGDTWPIFARET